MADHIYTVIPEIAEHQNNEEKKDPDTLSEDENFNFELEVPVDTEPLPGIDAGNRVDSELLDEINTGRRDEEKDEHRIQILENENKKLCEELRNKEGLEAKIMELNYRVQKAEAEAKARDFDQSNEEYKRKYEEISVQVRELEERNAILSHERTQFQSRLEKPNDSQAANNMALVLKESITEKDAVIKVLEQKLQIQEQKLLTVHEEKGDALEEMVKNAESVEKQKELESSMKEELLKQKDTIARRESEIKVYAQRLQNEIAGKTNVSRELESTRADLVVKIQELGQVNAQRVKELNAASSKESKLQTTINDLQNKINELEAGKLVKKTGNNSRSFLIGSGFIGFLLINYWKYKK